jgi:hypothetical protein
MGLVQGTDFKIYTGDSMNIIGCEESCSVSITVKEIITTTKGSGRGTNREYGSYDAILTSNGVVFSYSSESAAESGGQTDASFFHSYILQGKKVCAKYSFTSEDGIEKYAIANWIIRSLVFTGDATGFMTYDIELALDGELYESTALQSSIDIDGPSVYLYNATTTADTFTNGSMIGANRIYFVIKKTASTGIDTVLTRVSTLASFTSTFQFKFDVLTGTFTFSENFANGDVFLVSYDIDD